MIRPQLDGVRAYQSSGQPAAQEENEKRQALMWQVEWDGRFFEGSGRGRAFLFHGGSVKGFGAGLLLDVEADLAVAILANNYNTPAFEVLIAEFFRDRS